MKLFLKIIPLLFFFMLFFENTPMMQRYLQPITRSVQKKVAQKLSPLYMQTDTLFQKAKAKLPDWMYYLFRRKSGKQITQQRILSQLSKEQVAKIVPRKTMLLKPKLRTKFHTHRFYSTKTDLPKSKKVAIAKKTVLAGSIVTFLSALTKQAQAEDPTGRLKDVKIVDYDHRKDPHSSIHEIGSPTPTNPRKGDFHKAIYTDKGKLIGRIYYKKDTFHKNGFYIGRVVVSPEFQKKGYGTLLLHYAIEDAIDRGAETIRLQALTKPWGHHMYRKAGFVLEHPEKSGIEYIYTVPKAMQKGIFHKIKKYFE